MSQKRVWDHVEFALWGHETSSVQTGFEGISNDVALKIHAENEVYWLLQLSVLWFDESVGRVGPIVCSHYNDSVVIAMAYGREWGEEKKYKSETKCILDAWFRLCCVGLSSLFVIYFFFGSWFVLLRENGRMGIFSLWHFSESRLHLMLPAACWEMVFGFSFWRGEEPLKVFVLLNLILLCIVLYLLLRNVGVVSKTTWYVDLQGHVVRVFRSQNMRVRNSQVCIIFIKKRPWMADNFM